MKAIAERAGVSQAAVSHALRGTGKLAPATRERIQQLAEQMGFREDPMMSALAAYRSKKTAGNHAAQPLAFIVAQEPKIKWETLTDIQRLLAGVKEGAQQWGFKVEVHPHDGSPEAAQRISRVLYHRGIRAVILSFPRPFEREQPRQLDWRRFVTVSCKPLFSDHRFNSVSTDHFANGRLLYRKLHGMGYRRIGLCFSEALDTVSNRAFKAGLWTEERLLAPTSESITPLILAEWEEAPFRTWFAHWKPEVVVTQRWSILFWLRAMGLRVPDNVSLAVPSTTTGEFYSGIDQNHRLMGREAVRIVREHLILGNYGQPAFPLNVNVPSEWHAGGSLQRETPAATASKSPPEIEKPVRG